MIYPDQCERCAHLHHKAEGYFCDAFPRMPGIPLPILDMRFDHRQAYDGDHGIRWEPRTPGTVNPFDEEADV